MDNKLLLKPRYSENLTVQALMRSIQQDLPTIQYLALSRLSDKKCQWVFDFKNFAFLNDTKQKSFKPLLVPAKSEHLEMQCAFYEYALEYILRCGDHLIICRVDKEMSNLKLIEMTLQHQQNQLINLVKPPCENLRQPALQSVQAEMAVMLPLHQLQQALEGTDYVWEHELVVRPYLLSIKVRHATSKQAFVLKHFMQPVTAWLSHGEFTPFQLSQPLPGQVFLRPYVEAVSLQELVKRMGKLSPLQALLLLSKMSRELYQLHQQNQVHGNLVPTNILINRTRQTFLCDRQLHTVHRAQIDTNWFAHYQPFCAPEEPLTLAVPSTDMYMLGALAAYMLSGHAAFFAGLADNTRPLTEYLRGLITSSLQERYPQFLSILSTLLTAQAEARPTAGQLPRQLLKVSKISNR